MGECTYVIPLRNSREDLGFDYECDEIEKDGRKIPIVRLIKIAPGCAMARAGIKPGILKTLHHQPVTNLGDLKRAVRLLHSEEVTECVATVIHPPEFGPVRRGPKGGGAQHQPRLGLDPALAKEVASAAAEEELAMKLQRLATLRHQGLISEGVYVISKQRIMAALAGPNGGPNPQLAPYGTQEAAKFVPAAPYARLSVSRYVYLRTAPHKGSGWVPGEGVTGTLQVSRVEGAFALVRSLATGATGYVQARYLVYLPRDWQPGDPINTAGNARRGRSGGGWNLSDLFAPDSTEPSVGVRYPSRRERSLGPPHARLSGGYGDGEGIDEPDYSELPMALDPHIGAVGGSPGYGAGPYLGAAPRSPLLGGVEPHFGSAPHLGAAPRFGEADYSLGALHNDPSGPSPAYYNDYLL
eukprot:Hpha_TRINITY_DN8079_c0_g1::TRINITY_DN8079_c0_g1_i1::g.140110::m.140110